MVLGHIPVIWDTPDPIAVLPCSKYRFPPTCELANIQKVHITPPTTHLQCRWHHPRYLKVQASKFFSSLTIPTTCHGLGTSQNHCFLFDTFLLSTFGAPNMLYLCPSRAIMTVKMTRGIYVLDIFSSSIIPTVYQCLDSTNKLCNHVEWCGMVH